MKLLNLTSATHEARISSFSSIPANLNNPWPIRFTISFVLTNQIPAHLADVSDLIIVNASSSIWVKSCEDPGEFILCSLKISHLTSLDQSEHSISCVDQSETLFTWRYSSKLKVPDLSSSKTRNRDSAIMVFWSQCLIFKPRWLSSYLVRGNIFLHVDNTFWILSNEFLMKLLNFIFRQSCLHHKNLLIQFWENHFDETIQPQTFAASPLLDSASWPSSSPSLISWPWWLDCWTSTEDLFLCCNLNNFQDFWTKLNWLLQTKVCSLCSWKFDRINPSNKEQGILSYQ